MDLKRIMTTSPTPPRVHREQDVVDGSTPALRKYSINHLVWGLPLSGCLRERDLTHLILFNVGQFTVPQVWTELHASLEDMGWAIAKINKVSGVNRNPHMDMWVWKDLVAALLSVIHRQTQYRSWEFVKLVDKVQQRDGASFALYSRPRIESQNAAVTKWWLALWQPWRNR